MHLALRNLTHRYGDRLALNDLSLSFSAGEVTALLGPNGAGKSTLIKLLAGLLPLQQGEFEVEGRTKRAITPEVLASFGFVFQEPALDMMRSGESNLHYAAGLHGMNRKTRDERVNWVSDLLNVQHLIGRKPTALSGGERRRIEIARALLHKPQWLMLDEPSVGLDIDSRLQLAEDIHQLGRNENIGILWCTHITDELRPEDQLLIMTKGEVRYQGVCGSPEELMQTYQRITRAYV
jgi:ABC-2 type transport system ATP-binding protein